MRARMANVTVRNGACGGIVKSGAKACLFFIELPTRRVEIGGISVVVTTTAVLATGLNLDVYPGQISGRRLTYHNASKGRVACLIATLRYRNTQDRQLGAAGNPRLSSGWHALTVDVR